ncbi:MAG: YqgE/AlgH family protein, partial [Deltaproteobacteria bacterium]|nr:YqgE/AlgH family protein [Deltaproteobacteria bacterium]
IKEKQELTRDLFVSGTQEALEYFFSGVEKPFRFMLGYAGWGPGQLEKEMQEGSWLALPVESKYVFWQESHQIWSKVFEDLGIDPYQMAQGSGLH